MRGLNVEPVVTIIAVLLLCHALAYGQQTASDMCPDRSSSARSLSDEQRPTITISKLNIEGDLNLPKADVQQFADKIQQNNFSGTSDEFSSVFLNFVDSLWQEHGFFKARAHVDTRVLSSSPVNTRVAVTVHVDEGQQYRLKGIAFKNNHAVTNAKTLRNLFPMKDGEVFNSTAVRQGLERLRFAYAELGYINTTFLPDILVDEEGQTISLEVDCDEGKSFVISEIKILGLSPEVVQKISKEMYFKRGDVYNQRLVGIFLPQHASLLPANASPDSHIRIERDVESSTIALTFDFRNCPGD